jgi:hypothetical protein
MINFIGKALVVLHTVLSLVALAWAFVIYYEFIDWGRVEPRLEQGVRIPSEFDKSKVVFEDAVKGRNLVMAYVPEARASLREAEARFPENHLYYVALLKQLREGEGAIDVKAIKAEGPVATDTPGKAVGKVVPEVKLEGITKSQKAYHAELTDVQKEIDGVEKEIREWVEKNKDLTFQLTGKDDAAKRVKYGLYDLIDMEYQIQQRLKTEKEYLQPQWAQALEEARLFTLRRAGLEETLSRLQKGKQKK